MELSGLIFVALAVVWAVVLIPMALRHHDEASRTRAVDDFSDDLRVVARREAVSTRSSRLVVQGRAALRRGQRSGETASESDSTPDSTPATTTETVTESVVETTVVRSSRTAPARNARRLAAHRAAARAAARRRLRVLALLAVVTVGVAVGSLTGVLQPWAPAVPGGVVLAFLVLARVLVRREQRAWRAALAASRVDVSTSAPAGAVPSAAAEVREESLAAPSTPVAEQAPWAVVSGLDDTCAVPVGLSAAARPASDAASDAGSDAVAVPGALWDPLPVTLPTYVTKPRAHRSVRTIDLLDPGVVSSGRNAVDSALVAEAATAAPEAPEQDRAVGH